jgi:tRNA A-37 threonylcarbamoyl transferase component Bud32
MSARSGELLGPYRLREPIGQGGMGTVYRADAPDGRAVAVKVLRQGAPGEETARQRLEREVDTMRRVRSPFVAEVLDADVTGDPPYIVTQYAAGRTLEEVVGTDGPLTGQPLAALARGLAAALVAIHSAGVVHRDLKPGNVMLVDGQPVVIDFGIAQTPESTRLTMTGMFMGTPGYLAPEVIEGGDSSPAADVHSWAATVAYAATGRPPFGTGQFEAIFYRIVHGQADLDTLPAPLQPIVLAALAKDPLRRPSAAQLTGQLAALRPDSLVAAPPGAVLAASAAAAPVAYQPPWQLAGTAVDLPPVASRAGLAAPTAAPAAARPWPGTVPMAVQGRDNFADLLPPVNHQQAVRGSAPAPGWPQRAQQGPPAAVVARRADALPGSARFLLVLATMLGLVGVAIMFPLAGVAAALAGLMLLRAADLTGTRLVRRRAGRAARPAEAVSAAFFYPWAVVRTLLRFVLLAPMALLFAAAAATLTVLATGQAGLPRAVSYAAGALVACYGLGPGSAACRRPLEKFYSRTIRSTPAVVLGCVGLAAIAIAVVGAAVTTAPGYWPAVHLGSQLQVAATTSHPALASVTDAGRRLVHWLEHI